MVHNQYTEMHLFHRLSTHWSRTRRKRGARLSNWLIQTLACQTSSCTWNCKTGRNLLLGFHFWTIRWPNHRADLMTQRWLYSLGDDCSILSGYEFLMQAKASLFGHHRVWCSHNHLLFSCRKPFVVSFSHRLNEKFDISWKDPTSFYWIVLWPTILVLAQSITVIADEFSQILICAGVIETHVFLCYTVERIVQLLTDELNCFWGILVDMVMLQNWWGKCKNQWCSWFQIIFEIGFSFWQ